MSNAQRRVGSGPSNAPSTRWLIGASSWLLLVLIPGGALAWLGFMIIAGISRRAQWWIAGVAYGIAAIVCAALENGILQGTLSLVILVHALTANPAWLTLLWARRENGLTVTGTRADGKNRRIAHSGPRQRAASMPEEAQELLGATGTDRADYLATPTSRREPKRSRSSRASRRTAATSGAPSAAAAAMPNRPAASASPNDLVDVNTASQRELSRLSGMDRRKAKALIAERTKRGGFASLEDFGTAAGLQPHEIVRLGDEAFCSPRPRAARSFGRRLDL